MRPFRLIPTMTEAQQRSFWYRVAKASSDSCWEWVGSRSAGRGNLGINGLVYLASRVAYLLSSGVQPGSKCVCHSCDNPVCCNPHHLFLGTHLENMLDRDKKHRRTAPAGSSNSNAKLTDAQVRAIRKLRFSLTQVQLATKFGVKQPTISDILIGKTWKSLK